MRISGYGNYGTNNTENQTGSGSAVERYFGYKNGKSTSNKPSNGSNNSTSAISKTLALYESTKKGAEGVQEHGKKLTSQTEDSLFAKAKENKKTDDVVSEIEKFVTDYNSMATGNKNAGGRTNNLYTRQLRTQLNAARKDLRKIGISYDSDGTLKIDEKKLSAASVEDLEKAFSKDSFVEKAMTKSELIRENALENKELLSAAATNTYNKYGTYNNDSYFNYKG